ncbi:MULTISPECIES: hypothetical protein [unclassified Anaeromyxobacter]|uniref:hypothetical protein n=1 Tax=unclassified Anaeromyxobacter TaxID=2620896 RepID=UPI001F597509|nr:MULTISPECIES: hypothetical protein [unclassified Anaeromyxobacter]
MRLAARAAVGAAAIALAGGQCGVGGEGELACLEAVARLDACCPGLDATLFACGDGEGHASGCVVSYTSPALGLDESRCICARSCADLRDGGICSRASRTAPGGAHPPPLCP